MFSLKDKRILVIGGGGLLGQEFVCAIAEYGGIPVVGEKNLSCNNSLDKKIPSGKYHLVLMDMTSSESIQNFLAGSLKTIGGLDAVVNCAYPRNAGYGRDALEVTYKDFCENVSTHLGGSFLVNQQFGKFFAEKRSGCIVNIASIYGVIAPRFEIYRDVPFTMPVEYAAIKAGVIHLTRYFAKYFKGTGVRVNCISPGGIEGGQPEKFLQAYNQLGLTKGMLAAKDLQGALLFLLSEASEFVNGQNLIVDDGWTL